ncbi:guanine nucleotide exchange factor VAV3 [Tautogolabrus adspersus]
MMEYWRQCALWLINCKVLPANHRVTWESAQVFDLAQTLRDGVLLCHLLNNLRPQSINLKEINLRPQMSQFLCLKNIRTFLAACSDVFSMRRSELFEAFDLFDVRDFGKVMDTLSKLSHTATAQQTGIRPFPSEESVEDEDIYNHLEDLIDEKSVEDEEDLYDCVYDDEEGGEIYEDLMKTEALPPPAFQKQAETDIRSCCLTEIKQTEEKYTETLESIEKHFMTPLTMFLTMAEMEKMFVNIPDLVKVHKCLLHEIRESVLSRSAQDLYQIFITFKERLLIYGKYCSHVETAIATLDYICKDREDVRMKLEECSKRANYGKFTLRDLLVVPMQRVLKYPLLLQVTPPHLSSFTSTAGVHEEFQNYSHFNGLPKMLVIRNYFGAPSPVSGPPLSIQSGDIIELICADLHSPWWQGRILSTKEVGFFPSDAVKPCPCVPKPADYSTQPWFAGPMERLQAEAELLNRVNSTYLVRHRSKEYTEYAISIKYNNDVKHIKILTKDGCFYIAENKKFRSILELIEYYKHHSLREGFRSLDTTLQFPYREPENAAVQRLNRSGSNTPLLCGLSFVSPAGYSFVPPSSAPFWSVFTPKVIGVAIARYDFSSRDTRELSLQEGDVVKIYTKSGVNGWWRGEVNGRVGWFPSTYVEEGEE